MLRQTKTVQFLVVIELLIAAWVMLGAAVAKKAATPKPPDKLALGGRGQALLLLIDFDENGKISKQEWMKFMEAEFDRLDKDKKGQLEVKELTQSKSRVSHNDAGFAHAESLIAVRFPHPTCESDRQWTNGFGDAFVTRLRKLAVIPVQFRECL